MVERELVKERLLVGPTNIRFTKADGSERSMLATINDELIPETAYSEGSRKNEVMNDEVQVVWDIDKQDWRAFRWDRFLSVL